MKPDFQIEQVKCYNVDCMEFMKKIPDNYYDLAIVDPVYGSKNIVGGYTSGKGSSKGAADQNKYSHSIWKMEQVSKKCLIEIIRISKNQIIWGANHFISKIPLDSSCWIVWDKKNENTGFADCELAWTSFDTAVRKFSFRWNGMLQENMKEKETRIHPTQKPVALYKWLLSKYAKPWFKIFDSHGGSMTHARACLDLHFDLDICELDEEYFNNAVGALKNNSQTYLKF